MRHFLTIFSLILFSSAAQADPVATLMKEYQAAQQRQEGVTHLKSTRGFCVNTMLFTQNGPVVYPASRTCSTGFVGRDFAENFARDYGLTFVWRSTYMDLIYIPNGTLTTAPKGNFYFYINYDDYGRMSEVTATNDALP